MADIVVSYSRQDAQRIELLVRAFEAHGINVWWDRSLEQGVNYSEIIRKEIEDAKAAVICWSQAAEKSTWVQSEADEASHQGKYVGVLIATGRAPLPFNVANNANLKDWQGAADDRQLLMLLVDLGNKLGRPELVNRIEVQRRILENDEARRKAEAEAARIIEEQRRESERLSLERKRKAALDKEEQDRKASLHRAEEEQRALEAHRAKQESNSREAYSSLFSAVAQVAGPDSEPAMRAWMRRSTVVVAVISFTFAVWLYLWAREPLMRGLISIASPYVPDVLILVVGTVLGFIVMLAIVLGGTLLISWSYFGLWHVIAIGPYTRARSAKLQRILNSKPDGIRQVVEQLTDRFGVEQVSASETELMSHFQRRSR